MVVKDMLNRQIYTRQINKNHQTAHHTRSILLMLVQSKEGEARPIEPQMITRNKNQLLTNIVINMIFIVRENLFTIVLRVCFSAHCSATAEQKHKKLQQNHQKIATSEITTCHRAVSYPIFLHSTNKVSHVPTLGQA